MKTIDKKIREKIQTWASIIYDDKLSNFHLMALERIHYYTTIALEDQKKEGGQNE